jgi:hypothetical protein
VKCSNEFYKCAIHSIINPNPVYSHTASRDNIIGTESEYEMFFEDNTNKNGNRVKLRGYSRQADGRQNLQLSNYFFQK